MHGLENTPSSWNLGDDGLCNTIIGPSGATAIGSAPQQSAQQEKAMSMIFKHDFQ